MEKKTFDAFISHSSKDKELACSMVHTLELSGIKCWVAPRDINPGISYPSQIVNAIRNCQVFVLLVSERSIASEHVSSELERAFDYKKKLIPFMIDKVQFSDEQLYFLSRKQQIDAYSDFESGVETLKSILNAFIKNEKKQESKLESDSTIYEELLEKESLSSLQEKKQRFMLNVPEESIVKFESGFSRSLLDFIRQDEMLAHFYERLIYECVNVVKVIESARRIDILELEEIIENLSGAKNVATLSNYDSEFHKRLFSITGDDDFFEWWLTESKGLNLFINKFWASIGYDTKPFHRLVEIHKRIFQSIKEKDTDKAIIAMQEHFGFLLFQLLGNIYQSSR